MTEQFDSVRFQDQLSELPATIARRLANKDEIAKLLIYDSPDALSQSVTEEQKQKLFLPDSTNEDLRIFLIPLLDPNDQTCAAQIRIYVSEVTANLARRNCTPILTLDVICKTEAILLDNNFTRNLLLMQESHDLLSGYNCGTVGKMICTGIKELRFENNSTLFGYTLTFGCGSICL